MRLNFLRKSPVAGPITIDSPLNTPSPALSIDEKLDDYFIQEDSEALDVVADMLYRKCRPLGWVPDEQIHSDDWTDEVVLGVSVRTGNGSMRSCPINHDGMATFEDALMDLKVTAAVKMRSRAVEYTFKHFV
jgi:hypothetical protein